jgi:hypothetical protein
MLENEAKGSFGAFSSIGRITAETFINIKRKDLILNPKKNTGNKQIIIDFLKRNKYANIEGDLKEEEIKEPNEKNLDDSEIEDIEEESDIFALDKEEEQKRKEKAKKKAMINKDPFTCFHRTNEDAYKFHDLHMNKKKEKIIFETPNCTKYFPNKNLVWHRMPTCPKWETMESRKLNINKINDGSYLSHEDPLKNITKCFINMDKQTMRGDILNNNIRFNTAKPFISKKRENKSLMNAHKINDTSSSHRGKDNKNRAISGKDINKKINLEMNSKWKNNNIDHQTTTSPLQTISTIENQNEENLNKLIPNNNLTTQLTESPNNLNTIKTNKSNSQYEEQKNIDYSEKDEIHSNGSDSESSVFNDSYHRFKNLYTKQIKTHQKKDNFPKLISEKSKRSSINITNQSISVKSNSKIIDKNHKRPKTSKIRSLGHKEHIKGPEFDKIIPREYYDNLADNGLTLIPFSINNYTLVRERPLSVVVYKRKPVFKKKRKQFKGMEIEQYINPQAYNYLNNKCYVPIFNKMNTRPIDDGTPLPAFMKGVVSRDAYNITTDVSLKMNYFANGKSRGNYNTFLPKKSYNKIINLNLMNSKAFIDYLLINKKKAFESNDNIIKSLKFYNKNFKDLLKETSVSKFDNITFKTIKKQYGI